MKYLSLLALICTFAACKTSGPVSDNTLKGGKVLLTMSSPGDDPFNYRMTTDQEISTMTMGQTMEQNIFQQMDYTYQITDTDPKGNMSMELVMNHVKVKQSGLEDVDYDSRTDEDPSNMVGKLYNTVLGHQFEMGVAPSGELTKFEGGDEMIDKMFTADLGLPDVALQQLKATMKMQFGNAAMKDNMARVTGYIPEAPVKVGESWTKSTIQEMGMKMAIENTFTLDKLEDGKAYISFTGTLETVEGGDPVDMVSMKIVYDLEGTQEGNFIVDQATGWLLDGTINQKFGGNMNIDMEQMPAPFDAGMDALSTITFVRQ